MRLACSVYPPCATLDPMVVKKTVSPQLPPIHPGLQQKLKEAEEAEAKGETPRTSSAKQRIIRPSLDATNEARQQQVRTIGLVDPAAIASGDPRGALAQQAVFRPGTNLDAVWDDLSEGEKIRAGAVERFRLELEVTLGEARRPYARPHKIGGRLDARALRRSRENIEAELEAADHLFAPDVLALLHRFVQETHALVEMCLKWRAVQGLNAASMHALLADLTHKLMYQELVNRRRAMGDRGVRRICANIDLGEELLAACKHLPTFSPRERLLLRIIQVHQDLGHTAYAARISYRGSKMHRAYGARIFTDEMNRYRQLLLPLELELARTAVATHSSEELPLESARLLALIRAVDHLAPFAPHRVYKHLAPLAAVHEHLDALLAAAKASDVPLYKERKLALQSALAATALPPVLTEDICAALRPIEREADLVDLGDLAGDISGLQLDFAAPGAVRAQLTADPFAARYQALFDLQQDQLLRLARSTGVAVADLRTGKQLRFAKDGFGALEIWR